MARRVNKEIQLTSYEDLLGVEENEVLSDQIMELPIFELHDFKNHPFQVREDDEMEKLSESVKEYGVLNPALARPKVDGGYELISGHRRKLASIRSHRETMPVIVRDYSDDEAVAIMVDSNIQRENILPSEKAYAYKMKSEALKHQGISSGYKENTSSIIGKEAGDSGRTVQRYIRLTELIPELLEAVDKEKIKFMPAVFLSYLSQSEQQCVSQCITKNRCGVSIDKAKKLKEYSEANELTELAVELILLGEKREVMSVTLPEKRIRQYFPKEYGKEQIENIIISLLEQWKQNEERGEAHGADTV